MTTTTARKNEPQGAAEQAAPDASIAREFYDIVYRNALPLMDNQNFDLYYQPRWIKGAKGAVNVESVEWKTERWKRFIGGLDGYLKGHADHTLMPVPALFRSPNSAKLGDAGCVVALFFDGDNEPMKVYGKAYQVLGKLTCVVWSGSTWKNPETGKEEGKIHGYIRLKRPAVTPEEIAKAIEAQNLLTQITGGDSSMTIVHPLGLPGSINQKAGTLREIGPASEYAGPDSEIDLDEALAKLRGAAGVKVDGSKATASSAVKEFTGGTGGVDVEKVVADLIRGDDMHHNAARLAAHYAGKGLKRQAVWDIVKGIIDASERDQGRKDEFVESGELRRIVDSAVDKFSAEAFAGETPIPFDGSSSFCSDFPVDKLPLVMRQAVEAVARATDTPNAYSAMAALASASTAVCYISDVETLSVGSAAPTALYMMNIAQTGWRKSAVDSWFRKPFERLTRQRMKTYQARLDVYNASKAAYVQSEKDASKGKGTMLPKPVPPPAPAFLHSDATMEAVLKGMAEGGPLGSLWSAEAGMILGGAAFSRERAQASVSTLNLLWDGKDVSRSRVGGSGGENAKRGEITSLIVSPRLTANLAIHPDLAREFVTSPMNSNQGLTARVLLAFPDCREGSRLNVAPNVKLPEAEAFNDEVGSLLRLSIANAEAVYQNVNTPESVEGEAPESNPFDPEAAMEAGDTGAAPAPTAAPWNGLPVLRLSPAARTALVAFYLEHEVQLVPGGKLKPHAGLVNKLPEHAARIAGVLTLFGDPTAAEVTEATMKDALDITRWFLEARMKFESGSHGTDFELAAKLVDGIRNNIAGDTAFSRDIQRAAPHELRKNKKRLEEVIRILVENNWLLPLPAVPTRGGGPARESWKLNEAFRTAMT